MLLLSPYFMCPRFELNDKLLFLCLDCVLDCLRRRSRCDEGEPANEQYCEQENEDQFHDPEPEGQDFPEGYEDGKFNPIL